MKELRKNLENAVNAYTDILIERWELGRADCYWVGDRVGLDLFCFGDISVMSLEDIVYIVEQGITIEEFWEYEQYNVDASEFNFNHINLRSWHEGAPRMPKESIERLRKLKNGFEEAVKEATEGF